MSAHERGGRRAAVLRLMQSTDRADDVVGPRLVVVGSIRPAIVVMSEGGVGGE